MLKEKKYENSNWTQKSAIIIYYSSQHLECLLQKDCNMYNQYQQITSKEFLLTDSNGNELMAVNCRCLAEMQQKHDQFYVHIYSKPCPPLCYTANKTRNSNTVRYIQNQWNLVRDLTCPIPKMIFQWTCFT